MNKFTINDSNILDFFEKNGTRYKRPINYMPLMDGLEKNYHMSRDEIFTSLKKLEELNIIEGNGSLISLTEHYDQKINQKRSTVMEKQYTIEEKKVARFKMLEKIYEESGGSENSLFDIYEIGEGLNFPIELIDTTYDYLIGEKLIKSKTIGGGTAITHFGIMQYEKAVSVPDKPSDYFLPVNIIKSINFYGDVKGSQIQLQTTNSNQTMNNNDNYNELKVWLQNLEDALIKSGKQEQLDKIQEDIDFIRANIATENPNKKYIGKALGDIKTVLLGLTSSAIFQKFLSQIPILIP